MPQKVPKCLVLFQLTIKESISHLPFIALSLFDRNMSAITEDRELLPANVKPLHYSLELEPDFTTFETNGSVTIELDVVEASTEISLHACEIKVESIMLTRDGVVEEPQSDK